MLKKLFFFVVISLIATQSFTQVLYSERFNALSLTTATYSSNNTTQTYQYADVPNAMFTINNGNLIADTLTGNYPFRANSQKQKAWLSYVPVNATDTFAVSTSWIKPVGTTSAWLITPTISNVAANSVLTWEALAPDMNNQDGYEVYVSTVTTGTPNVSNFTTLVFNTTAEKSTWQTHGISLASFAGQNIRIAFKNNSTNKYQLWIDDIIVSNITNGFDVSTISHNVYKYSTTNINNAIVATFKNNGFTPISNLTINYKLNNGSTITETKIFSPALNYLDSKALTFTIPYNTPTPQYNTFKIWPSFINGQSDQVAANDTVNGSITISSSVPTKNILVEQFASTTCGWCPDGLSTINSIVSTNTNVISSEIHYNDNLTSTSTAPLFSSYGDTDDFPSAMIDRYLFAENSKMASEKTDWSSYITQRQAMRVPATVTITNVTYNSSTRQINATVTANFVGDVKGQYGLNLYVKENNIYGKLADSSDNQWNQHNSLYNISSSSFYQYGNLIGNNYVMSAVSYKHKHVINELLDGWIGDLSLVPTNGSTSGQSYSKTYTYTLPNVAGSEFRYNADNIYLIGVISEYDINSYNGIAILNSAEVKLTSNAETTVGINEKYSQNVQLNIFPNPTSDICQLSYTLKNDEYVKVNVYNTLGELVYMETKNVSAGNVSHELNLKELNAGNYSVQVSFKNTSITKKLTIIK